MACDIVLVTAFFESSKDSRTSRIMFRTLSQIMGQQVKSVLVRFRAQAMGCTEGWYEYLDVWHDGSSVRAMYSFRVVV